MGAHWGTDHAQPAAPAFKQAIQLWAEFEALTVYLLLLTNSWHCTPRSATLDDLLDQLAYSQAGFAGLALVTEVTTDAKYSDTPLPGDPSGLPNHSPATKP